MKSCRMRMEYVQYAYGQSTRTFVLDNNIILIIPEDQLPYNSNPNKIKAISITYWEEKP